MAEKTAVTKATARMREVIEQKAKEEEEIRQKLEEAQAEKVAAEMELQVATESMNLTEYEKAKDRVRRAKMAIEMYGKRYAQLGSMEMITEEESDRMIDDLLAYEAIQTDTFKAAFRDRLGTLADDLRAYLAEVEQVENTIRAWCSDVHANYRSPGTIYSETGTNRSPVPVPVHRVAYRGCDEARELDTFLRKYGI